MRRTITLMFTTLLLAVKDLMASPPLPITAPTSSEGTNMCSTACASTVVSILESLPPLEAPPGSAGGLKA